MFFKSQGGRAPRPPPGCAPAYPFTATPKSKPPYTWTDAAAVTARPVGWRGSHAKKPPGKLARQSRHFSVRDIKHCPDGITVWWASKYRRSRGADKQIRRVSVLLCRPRRGRGDDTGFRGDWGGGRGGVGDGVEQEVGGGARSGHGGACGGANLTL